MRKELVIQKTKSQDREAGTIFLHAYLSYTTIEFQKWATRAKIRIDELCTAITFASV